MKTIPLKDLYHYTQNIVLDTINYEFEMRWDQFNKCWYISIYDYLKNPIVTGYKLVINQKLFRDISINFNGELYIIANSQDIKELTFDNITDGTVTMYYLSKGESV